MSTGALLSCWRTQMVILGDDNGGFEQFLRRSENAMLTTSDGQSVDAAPKVGYKRADPAWQQTEGVAVTLKPLAAWLPVPSHVTNVTASTWDFASLVRGC